MAAILLVDDNQDLRLLLTESLESEGHVVTQAADGAAAIALLRSAVYDLIITDVLMPEADGTEVIAALRGRTPRPALLVMSGGGRIEPARYLQMAKALGADAVLQKPFTPIRLNQLVIDLLAARPAATG